MAARSVGKVVIGFGFITIAVKLYLAASAERISLHMINPFTKNRIRQKMVDAVTGEEVIDPETGKPLARDKFLHGHEYAKDNMVIFTDAELDNMQAEKQNQLKLSEFVPLSSIDLLQVEKSYYIMPDKGMEGSYQMLSEALKKISSVGIGTWVTRGKEHLVVIRPYKHGLVMHQMFYQNEIRAFDEFVMVETDDEILDAAVEYVSNYVAESYDPTKYVDRYAERLAAAIQTKINGGSIAAVSAATDKPVSNKDALKAALAMMNAKAKEERAAKKAPEKKPEPKVEDKPAKKTGSKKR